MQRSTRLIDVMVSLGVLIAASPLLLLIAVANRILTGRILFRQTRVGRAMSPFTIMKFQTMRDGAPGGSTVTVADDRRVTPFGRLLRTLKLDELPQLVNVLRGEMSLVGPRALTPNEVARIPAEVAARVYSVRPGMTGLASLVFADEERALAGVPRPEEHYFDVILPQKMAIETVYVQRKSLWMDALILLLTPLAIVLPATIRRFLTRLLADAGVHALTTGT
jgi:lipopolysaccharide/colanic/teichoic acid biosynthesis glycosyltransferase